MQSAKLFWQDKSRNRNFTFLLVVIAFFAPLIHRWYNEIGFNDIYGILYGASIAGFLLAATMSLPSRLKYSRALKWKLRTFSFLFHFAVFLFGGLLGLSIFH